MTPFGLDDLKLAFYNMGFVFTVISPMFLLPLLAAYYYGEADMVLPFVKPFLLVLGVGVILIKVFRTKKEMRIRHAIIMTAFSYVVICFFSALPLLTVSPTFLDAYFEAVSGWTTTGLSTIASGADSFPKSINLWRHLMQYFGGLGMVILSLVVLSRAKTGIESTVFYVGEGRTEKIGSSIVSTTRAMLLIYLMFFVFSALGLYLAGAGLFDAVCHAMAGLSTGGFSTHAASIQYFNSTKIEFVTVIIMTIGAMNFVLHYAIITGRFKEIVKNIEMQTFVFLLSILSIATVLWLAYSNSYLTFSENFRFGFYQIVSGLTTTGWMNQSSDQLRLWWPLAQVLVAVAMIIGSGTGSTGGGIKWMRVGLIARAIYWNVKKTLYPESAIVVKRIHHIEEKEVDESVLLEAFTMVSAYLVLLLISTLITAAYGYTISESLFESSSALSTVGHSIGITSLGMPIALKVLYIIDMLAGRFEILPIIVAIVFLSDLLR